MAETLVLNMKGNFTDRISPGAGKAYRSLEKLDKKMEKIIRQSNRLNGLKINMEISAADMATKKIQSILSLGRQLERKAFTVRVNVDTNVQKAISTIGSVSGNISQRAVSSVAPAIQYGAGQAIGGRSISSSSAKPKESSKQKPFIEKVWDKGKALANEYKDNVVSNIQQSALERTIKEYKDLSMDVAKEAGLPEKVKAGVTKIKGGASKVTSKVKSWPISKTIGRGVEKVAQVAPKIKELPITKTLGKGMNFLKQGAPGILDYGMSAYNIATAKPKDRAKTAVKEGGSLFGGAVGTAVGTAAGTAGAAWVGGKIGGTIGTVLGGPVGTVIGTGAGLLLGTAGSMIGKYAGGKLYDGYQNLKKSVKNIKLPKPLAKSWKFLKKKVQKGIKNFLTPKTPKTPTKPSDKIDPYGVGNGTYSDYMYNPGFKYGYDTLTKGQKGGAKKKKAGKPIGKDMGQQHGKGFGNMLNSTVKQTKKGLNSVDKGAKGAKKGMSGVGKSSKKAQGNIKGLGSSSNGSQKQVQGLGDGSQNAAGMIEGMGGSAIGVVDSLVMLSGAAQMAAASLAGISFFGLMGGGGIQKNANGSFVGGKTLSWVGEDGPEVIISGRKEKKKRPRPLASGRSNARRISARRRRFCRRRNSGWKQQVRKEKSTGQRVCGKYYDSAERRTGRRRKEYRSSESLERTKESGV